MKQIINENTEDYEDSIDCWLFLCDNCGNLTIYYPYKFCANCGKEIEYEEGFNA